ncbi:YjjG family noncanonical pyrimidine nucleotidase [Croceitalea sp. MTPC9]|uniref:YjjG family noncanonical pyrimidine nucleotidase n=1 Tax=unclassified Croceitalea TaxID=2632280 RepID=UPI002B3A237E|nr:YjjG family noncanonical pyrimidine nucleotidase [Croceitalea sp. MTPC6]GMN17801.1 YjjG family noncanonical pyrimidine nucleotidase [Croceitalea sp. MTPC9]
MFDQPITDIFFDLDHTLWDFEKNSALTFKKILKKNQVNVPIEDFLKSYVPINLEYWKLYREEKVTKAELRYQRLKETFDTIKFEVSDDLIDTLSDEYIQYLSTFNHVFPHTFEILEYLKPKYRLHIITNGFQEIQDKKLKNANLYNYFGQIINSEMAGVKKPNPKIFKMALNLTKTKAESSVMIGDNIEADILGAQALGFHTLHFNAHNEPAHDFCKMIDSLHEIKLFL